MKTPIIEATPLVDLFDSKVYIKISNVSPGERITVKAKMMDQFGHVWESFANFIADQDGNIELDSQAPIEGSYKNADRMGLFWSMKRVSRLKEVSGSALNPISVSLDFHLHHQLIKSITLIRRFQSEDVIRKEVRENGLVGTYFYPETEQVKQAVIYLGGSEGGLMERKAALLASHGFAVFGLAYFRKEHLPSELVEIPLEYIESAIHWLLSQEGVNIENGVKLVGISKGGELALLAASKFREVTGVAGIVPSSVVYPGLGSKFSSSWAYKGKPVSFLGEPIPEEILKENDRKKELGNPIQYRNTYLARLEQVRVNPDAIIPVENIKGDVLIFSGDDDQLWPSDVHGDMIIDRLKNASFPYDYEHVKYAGAGHSFYIPYWPTAYTQMVNYGLIKMDLGGTCETAAFAQEDSWRILIAFLKK